MAIYSSAIMMFYLFIFRSESHIDMTWKCVYKLEAPLTLEACFVGLS
jgi:hypothetical protein